MANKGNHEPFAIKNTFWNRQRVAKHIKLSELANLLGCGVSTLGSYFSGQHVPSEDIINQLCILLDVDPLEGTREFIKANKDWDTHRGRKAQVVLKSSASEETTTPPCKSDEDLPKASEPCTKVSEPRMSVPESVLRILYDILPYESFEAILDGAESEIDLLEYVYNKVGFEEYIKIRKIVKE